MQRSLTWIATAVLFASLLSGCAAQTEFAGSPAGKGTSAVSSPIGPPRQRRFETILGAPSAFDCRGQEKNDDVFEEQCESNTRSGD
jgi:hypothetical protein